MGRSQRHRVEEQGFSAAGVVYEQGAINDQILKRLGGPGAVWPVLTSINPTTAVKGGADLTLHCIGTGFTADCVILFNGGAEVTTLVSPTELTTLVKPSLVTVAGTYPVQIRKAGILNSTTKPFTFTNTAVQEEGGEGAARSFPIGPISLVRIEDDDAGIALIVPDGSDIQVGDTVLCEATFDSNTNGSYEVISVDGTRVVVDNPYALAAPIEAKGRVTVTAGA